VTVASAFARNGAPFKIASQKSEPRVRFPHRCGRTVLHRETLLPEPRRLCAEPKRRTNMNGIIKPVAALGLAGALALAATASSEARPRGWGWGAAGVGLAAGALIGAAAANANAAYYYGPDYAYDPYYAAAPVYVAPGYTYGYDSYGYAPTYSRYQHGYDTNYIGPWRERQLEGRD
jgi:hypothetical protein